MRKHWIFVTIAALGALVCSCEREKDITTPGVDAESKLVFKVGAATRAEFGTPVVKQGQILSLGDPIEGHQFFLEETVSTVGDEIFVSTPETRGTPVYTENFDKMAVGKFQGAAFPVKTMTDGKISDATYPDKSWADFEQNGEFWEHSYPWDPWFDQPALLFYAKMLTESTGGPAEPKGVVPNSYRFLNNDTDGQSMTFSYRSPMTAQDQEDIVFAARKITKQEAKVAVPILFYHALTGVKFATAWSNDSDVKTYIKKVEFTGIYGYGKCTIKPVTENGGYTDDPDIHSSGGTNPAAVSWSNVSFNGVNSRTAVYSQEYPDNYVGYTDGHFASKGDYPESFSAAGNTQNLNDGDATMTFWFPPQTLSNDVKLKVTFEVELNTTRKEFTRELDFGTLTGNVEWKPGQIRTYTLKPNEVDVDIHDKVSGYKKDQVEIRNTGNVDAFIRAMIVANWWGYAGNEEGVAMGYTDDQGSAFITPWSMSWNASASTYVDNYGGVFDGLPAPDADGDWKLGSDGYFYFTKPVPPGKLTGEPGAVKPLFNEYNLDTQEHPVPRIYYLDASVKEYTHVYLKMEIPVQAIEAKEGETWSAAWSAVLNYNVQ
ncbi:MAG: hypothetical protein J6P69_06420 [Bacteroidales bacterium]|nr:hypothetical protein [Bacteroidales bacterium]